MGVTITNVDTGEFILHARHCTSFYNIYAIPNRSIEIVNAPLSYYDAAKSGNECQTDVLDPTDEERFKGKIALYMEDNSHCKSTYYENTYATMRVQQAGGLGIIFLNPTVTVPGLWHDFDNTPAAAQYKTWFNERGFNESLPVLHCGHSILDGNLTQRIQPWVTAMYNVPANKVPGSPYFNQNLSVSIVEDPNLWQRDMQTGMNGYFIAMKLVLPLVCFTVMLGAIKVIIERNRLLSSWFTMQNIALGLEGTIVAVLGIFLAVDGFYATPYSAMALWRAAMIGNLSFVSATTTLVVGLNFAAFRRSVSKMEIIDKPYAERFKWVILFIGASFCACEVAGVFLRVISMAVSVILNSVLILTNVVCIIWFATEVRGFVQILHRANETQHDTAMDKFLTHTIRWTIALMFSMGLRLISAFVTQQNPTLFTPSTWMVTFPTLFALRLTTSLCVVNLLKPVNKTGRQGVNKHTSRKSTRKSSAGYSSAIVPSESFTTS